MLNYGQSTPFFVAFPDNFVRKTSVPPTETNVVFTFHDMASLRLIKPRSSHQQAMSISHR